MPAKKKLETRDLIMRIRVTENERRALKERAGGQVAPWLRDLGLGQKPARRNTAPDVSPELVREMARIGNNLNQLARLANEQKKGGFDFDTLGVLEKLDALQSELKALREAYTNDR